MICNFDDWGEVCLHLTSLVAKILDLAVDFINLCEMDTRFFNLLYFFYDTVFFLPRNALSLESSFEFLDSSFQFFLIVINGMDAFLLQLSGPFLFSNFVIDCLNLPVNLLLLDSVDFELLE